MHNKKIYDILNDYYSEIFPVGKNKKKFFADRIQNNGSALLEIGCATGDYANFFSEIAGTVDAIDLNSKFISTAKDKYGNKPNLNFHELNMLNISDKFKNEKFDYISCLGNTIVHLPSFNQIEYFLLQVSALLSDEGTAFLQLVNYENIIESRKEKLPEIKFNDGTFNRYYSFDKLPEKIIFQTEIVTENDKVSSSTELTPIKLVELKSIVEKSGLRIKNLYSDFAENSFENTSSGMILVVQKPYSLLSI